MTFFNCVGLSRSHIYFKMLRKFLRKFPVLKILTLTPSYFKSNLFQRQTYLVRKKNVSSIIYYNFYPCLDNFVYSGEFYPWKTLFMENFI